MHPSYAARDVSAARDVRFLFVSSDPELASYLRIAERELDVRTRN
jgi:hypothetical protein